MSDGSKIEPTDSSRGFQSRGGSKLSRRFPVALLLYGLLGMLVWFTVGSGTVLVFRRPIELRIIPLVVIASFVLRTVLTHQADRIRADDGR